MLEGRVSCQILPNNSRFEGDAHDAGQERRPTTESGNWKGPLQIHSTGGEVRTAPRLSAQLHRELVGYAAGHFLHTLNTRASTAPRPARSSSKEHSSCSCICQGQRDVGLDCFLADTWLMRTRLARKKPPITFSTSYWGGDYLMSDNNRHIYCTINNQLMNHSRHTAK